MLTGSLSAQVWSVANIACHTCENRGCVNPRHVYSGTKKTNANDRRNDYQRKYLPGVHTRARGEKHGSARLTEEQVAEIRATYRPGVRGHGLRALAKKYGVGATTLWNVVHNLHPSRYFLLEFSP